MASHPQTIAPTTPQNRLQIFANAFKGYMGVMALVTSVLAPLPTSLRAIPTYEGQRTTLAKLTGILGFLLLAWLFYVRRTIALGSMIRGFRFLINMTPFLLIVETVACFIGYFRILGLSSYSAPGIAVSGEARMAHPFAPWTSSI
jgi:hypothetical protein